MAGRFRNKYEAMKMAKPIWACLKCGWFTQEGKTRVCPECSGGRNISISTCEHFDSQGEYYRYKQLELMQRGKIISKLERQVPYHFHAFNKLNDKPVKIFTYYPDFRYLDKDGNVVIEDYKPGLKPKKGDPNARRALDGVFMLKQRAMKLVYNIDVKLSH